MMVRSRSVRVTQRQRRVRVQLSIMRKEQEKKPWPEAKAFFVQQTKKTNPSAPPLRLSFAVHCG